MTPTDGIAAIGLRVAAYREIRKLTAAQLADSIPGAAITRAIVVNIENGRKRDLTATETMLIAAALRVPVLALLVDVEQPWRSIGLDGMPEPYASMSAAEYLVANELAGANLDSPAIGLTRGRMHGATQLLIRLRRLEHLRFDLEEIFGNHEHSARYDDAATVLFDRGDGTAAYLDADDFSEEGIGEKERELIEETSKLVRRFLRERRFAQWPDWLTERVRAVVEYADAREVEVHGESTLKSQFLEVTNGPATNSAQ
jgi:transcriptional regulator with XRE-family HTH domain